MAAHLVSGGDLTCEKIQEGRSNAAGWKFFCDVLLPRVVMSQPYKRNVGVNLVRNFATVSDIAFVHLIIENSWAYWSAVAEHKRSGSEEKKVRKDYPECLWTAKAHGGGTNKGWDWGAVSRFNVLCRMEVEGRRNKELLKVEEEYLLAEQAKTKKKARVRKVEEKYEEPAYQD